MSEASTQGNPQGISKEEAASTIDAVFGDETTEQVATEPQSTAGAEAEPEVVTEEVTPEVEPASEAPVVEDNANARTFEQDWKKLYSESSREAKRLAEELKKAKQPQVEQPQPAPQLNDEARQAVEYLQSLGFVRKDDVEQLATQKANEVTGRSMSPIQKKMENEILNDFYKAHPEVDPKNDADNANWNTILPHYSRYAPQDPSDPYNDLRERLENAWILANKDSLLKKAANEGASRERVRQKMATNASAGGGSVPSKGSVTQLSPLKQQLEDEWGISDIKLPAGKK